MTSTHLVDPEILPFLELMPQLRFDTATVPLYRAGFAERFAALTIEEDPRLSTESFTVPGPEAAPPVRLLGYRPAQAPGPVPAILHIHGGGYLIGMPEMNDATNRGLALALGCAIFSVDYRLAPEHQYPAPVEDCYAALAWLFQNAASLNIDPARIGVKGESAGGGLAACLALLARDRGEYKLSFQHLIYPMLDDRNVTRANAHPHTGEFVWTKEDNHFGWSSMLGAEPGGPNTSPYAAAARAEDLANLPPTYISVGALDLFLEEDLDYARRLTRAGVAIECHVYPGGYHGFDVTPGSRVAAQSNRDSLEALRRAMLG